MKTLISAVFIGFVSTFSMTYMFNNLPGTNNQIATYGGAVTALAYLALKYVRVA